MATRRTQADRREATRAALIAAGRELFAERGYESVGTPELVEAAGVTRGALYHHFDGKKGLFEAVFESVEQELVESFPIERLVGADPYGALEAGIGEFLELSLDHELQRITIIDAPAVLGWERWHEIQVRYGLGLIRAAVAAAIEAGQLEDLAVEEVSSALLGALIEAALFVSRSPDPDAAVPRMRLVLERLLAGLRR